MEAGRRNPGHYGVGIKGFVLSMIETAIEVTDDAVPAAVIRELLRTGREMLDHLVELLPLARAAVEAGAWGVLVPDGLEREIEKADPPTGAPRFREIADLGELPALVRDIETRLAR